VVTKADGELAAAARRTQAEYHHALRLMRPAVRGWTPRVVRASALEGTGIPEIWKLVEQFREALVESGLLAQRRAEQATAWMWSEIREGLLALVRENDELRRQLRTLERRVAEGRMAPGVAADRILSMLRPRPGA
jgi:LAO/AO transport system kinase